MKVLCIDQPTSLPTHHGFQWLWMPKPLETYHVYSVVEHPGKQYYQLREGPVGHLFEAKLFIPLTD